MKENQASYKQIFKSTSIFGGVQAFTILVSIIRSKFIAVLIGPTGIGISGLLNSTISLITALTSLGLERSAVKNIAAANGSNDNKRISIVVTVLRKLVWVTGIIGFIFTLVFSKYLSRVTFGNSSYSWAFILLSVTLLLNQISVGQSAVLRGMRQLKYLAQASLFGSIIGLFVSVPLYFYFNIKGIVPAILISSVVSLALTFYFSKKMLIKKVTINKENLFHEGKDMVTMGFVLSLHSLILAGSSYLIRIFIRAEGSIEDVGFYNAGFAIVNSYFDVFFTALVTDYYPRLAGIANDTSKANKLMNEQSEMSILILTPLLAIFLVFINPIISVLYSHKFLPISDMILWAAIGIYFKAGSWSLGVIFVSKGDVKTLFWSELSSNIVVLVSSILGYKYFGLNGIGMAFFISFLFTFIQTYLIVRLKYAFRFVRNFNYIFTIQILLGCFAFLSVKYLPILYSYLIGIIIIFVSTTFSIFQLNDRIGTLDFIKQKYKKLKN